MINEATKSKLEVIFSKRRDFYPFAQCMMVKDKPVITSAELLRDCNWGDSKPVDYAAKKLLIDFLRELEKAGLGQLVIGRKGKETRFNWNLMITNGASKSDETGGDSLMGTHSTNPNRISHTFVLRQDFVASIELPKDLTKREAERLASFCVTLPLES